MFNILPTTVDSPIFDVRLRSHMDTYGWCPREPNGQEQEYWRQLHRQGQNPARRRVAYIHIPFCSRICTFCSFNRQWGDVQDAADYLQWVQKELDWFGHSAYVRQGGFEALYIGGGTPTLLPSRQMAWLIRQARSILHLDDHAEITLESTIHDLDRQKLEAVAEAGVNRISFGIQTFNTQMRHRLGRVSDAQTIQETIFWARQAGVPTLSADFLYRLPGQSVDDVLRDMQIAHQIGLDGISIYPLIVMKHTPLEKQIENRQIQLPPLRVEIEQYLQARQYLIQAGYRQSTSTHFNRSRDSNTYNTVRLNDGDCLAIGAGAGGFYGPLVTLNAPGLEMYRSRIEKKQSGLMVAVLTDGPAQAMRTISGQILCGTVVPETISASAPQLSVLVRRRLDEYVEMNYMKHSDSRYLLTDTGYAWCYNLAADIIQTIQHARKADRQ